MYKKINSRIKKISDTDQLYTDDFIQELKTIMAMSGYDCESMVKNNTQHTHAKGNTENEYATQDESGHNTWSETAQAVS
jgi:hypothetical protein